MRNWLSGGSTDPSVPVPGLAAVAAGLGWQGPSSNPDLTPVVDYDLFQPAAFPEPYPATMIGDLMLRLHAAFPRSKRISHLLWRACGTYTDPTQPSLSRLPAPMLAHCYQDLTSGMTVGTGFYWLARQSPGGMPLNSRAPGSAALSSGFCVVQLAAAYPVPLQVVPLGLAAASNASTGDPRLDSPVATEVTKKQFSAFSTTSLSFFTAASPCKS